MKKTCQTMSRVLMVIFCGILIALDTMALDRKEKADTIVITEEEIRAMNAHTMADILNHVPGVTAGDSSVGIHGSYKVKVFVDGRPINDPTSSTGGVNWELVKPDDVERIEILRGKGGLQYGQDASGGVVLITTRETRSVTGSVKAYGGNYDTYYGYTSLQQAKGPWTMAVNGGYEETGGYKTNNDKTRSQAGLKWGYQWDDQYRIRCAADYLEDERGSSGQPDYPTPDYRKSSNNTNVSVTANLGPWTNALFFNQGENHNTDPSRNLDQTLEVTQWGEDLNTHFNTENWGTFSAGASYRLNQASGSDFDDQSEETYSLFMSQNLSFPKSPLSFGLGLRANINTDFDDVLNPEIKLSYKLDKMRVAASFNQTNNTPSFRQRFNQTSSTIPNPDLTMETSDNYSLACFIDTSEHTSLSLTLFHNRLTDRITYISENGIGQYQNVGLVTYTGGDLAGSYSPHTSVTFKGGYTYLEAVDEDTGLWLTAKARHTVNLDAYVQPFPSLSLALTNKYVSKVYRNKANTTEVPGYSISDVRIEYTYGRYRFFSEVENLFDKTYYYADGLLAPPRVWKAGVTVTL